MLDLHTLKWLHTYSIKTLLIYYSNQFHLSYLKATQFHFNWTPNNLQSWFLKYVPESISTDSSGGCIPYKPCCLHHYLKFYTSSDFPESLHGLRTIS